MNFLRIIPALTAAIILLAVSTALAERYSIPGDIPGLIESGKTAEAKARLNEFRRAQPENPLALLYLARIERDRNLARALYREVERLGDPDLATEAVFARAEMYIEDGDRHAAEPLLVKVVTTRPNGPCYADALYRLGMIRLAGGKPEDALLQLVRSREAQTDGFKKTLANAGILECHVARKDWNGVLDASREVLDGRDDTGALTPRVLEAVILAWHSLGNEANAEKFARRLLSNFPRSYQAYELRLRGGRITEDSPPPSAKMPVTADNNVAGHRNGTAFTIQTGAFVDRVNALKAHNTLKNAGFPARVDMKKIGDKHFYMIRVGEYATREAADETALRIARITGTRAVVVMME